MRGPLDGEADKNTKMTQNLQIVGLIYGICLPLTLG